MALVHSPRIVTDGLVLSLDAGNTKSYSGSGTTWTDLVNQVDSTVSGTPSFSNGIWTFSGDDYVDFNAPNLSTTASVEMWCKPTQFSNKMLFGWLQYDMYTPSGALGFNTAASDCYGLTSAEVVALGLGNKVEHYVFVMRTDVSYTNNKIYINTESQSLSQVSGTENATNRSTFNSGNGRIACWRFDTNYIEPMEIGIFNVYNKELSADEVKQNFNAHRGRFGL